MISHRHLVLSSQSSANNSDGVSMRCNAKEQITMSMHLFLSSGGDASSGCVFGSLLRSVVTSSVILPGIRPSAISRKERVAQASFVRLWYASAVYCAVREHILTIVHYQRALRDPLRV